MAGGGPASQEINGLPWHWPRGGALEGSDGGF